MKAILKFKLPKDQVEHMVAVNAMRLYSIIDDIENTIRQYRKIDISEETEKALQHIEDCININLDDMQQ